MATTEVQTFHLRFLAHEDEAQMTGYDFEVDGNDVTVKTTFNYQEYEDMCKDQHMTLVEARQFWLELVSSGEFEERTC